MKVVFFGTPAFATPFLEELIRDPEVTVVGVVTQPDKRVGRNGALVRPLVKEIAHKADIPCYQPRSLKMDAVFGDILREMDSDFFVVVAYGKIIPPRILSIPRVGCINVHPSLLPRHRGPSPIQTAILEGDRVTGVTIMLLDEGMDTGPILSHERIQIDDDETYHSLVQKIYAIGPKLLTLTMKRYVQGRLRPIKQDERAATGTRLLTREDGRVDWSQSMIQIDRAYRAYVPWPGTWTGWQRTADTCLRLKLLKLLPVDIHLNGPNGIVMIQKEKLFVRCADGAIEILEIQMEGKPRMRASEFIAGHYNIHGAILQ